MVPCFRLLNDLVTVLPQSHLLVIAPPKCTYQVIMNYCIALSIHILYTSQSHFLPLFAFH